MDSSGTRHSVPVPSFLGESAGLRRDRLAGTDELGGTIALIASETVVCGIYLGTPYIGIVSLQRHHPVIPPVYAESGIIQHEETLRCSGSP